MASSKVLLKTVAVEYGCAGKTSMFITYTTKEFPGEYVSTVFDNYAQEIDANTQLDLWDTGGGEDYARLRPLSYPHTDAFIIGFDVAREDLFAELESYWYAELRHHCPDVPIILTATKIDLRETEENCVTTEEGETLATKTRSHYAEISSLKGIGLDELFEKVVHVAREHKAPSREKSKKCLVL